MSARSIAVRFSSSQERHESPMHGVIPACSNIGHHVAPPCTETGSRSPHQHDRNRQQWLRDGSILVKRYMVEERRGRDSSCQRHGGIGIDRNDQA
jgi:hypothetical protein